MDLRERVVRAVEGGVSRHATAAQYDVSPSFVVKLMQRWRQRGTLEPDQIGGWKRAKLADHAERVEALLSAEPDTMSARNSAISCFVASCSPSIRACSSARISACSSGMPAAVSRLMKARMSKIALAMAPI
jgi:hypothetical protein